MVQKIQGQLCIMCFNYIGEKNVFALQPAYCRDGKLKREELE